jgi:hypothetical protein
LTRHEHLLNRAEKIWWDPDAASSADRGDLRWKSDNCEREPGQGEYPYGIVRAAKKTVGAGRRGNLKQSGSPNPPDSLQQAADKVDRLLKVVDMDVDQVRGATLSADRMYMIEKTPHGRDWKGDWKVTYEVPDNQPERNARDALFAKCYTPGLIPLGYVPGTELFTLVVRLTSEHGLGMLETLKAWGIPVPDRATVVRFRKYYRQTEAGDYKGLYGVPLIIEKYKKKHGVKKSDPLPCFIAIDGAYVNTRLEVDQSGFLQGMTDEPIQYTAKEIQDVKTDPAFWTAIQDSVEESKDPDCRVVKACFAIVLQPLDRQFPCQIVHVMAVLAREGDEPGR